DKNKIDINTINKWINDPVVRVNLLNNATLSIYSAYFPKGNKKVDRVKVFDSKYMQDYIDYLQDVLLPIYLKEMKTRQLNADSIEGDQLKNIVKAIVGHLP